METRTRVNVVSMDLNGSNGSMKLEVLVAWIIFWKWPLSSFVWTELPLSMVQCGAPKRYKLVYNPI
jgi:hypothetical protein